MAYEAEISRTNPSCFLFLIDRSSSMSDPIAGAGSSRSKAQGVADAINRLLQNLVLKCAKSEGVRDYYEVGVIGYSQPKEDEIRVGNAFTGVLAERDLVPISQVANNPARIEERTRKVEDGAGGLVDQAFKLAVWFDPVADGGTPMCAALRHAYQILQDWVSRYPSSYPPIVINITDGEATDGDPLSEGEGIKSLATGDGNVLLFNCHISSLAGSPITYPDSEAGLPDQHAQLLFRMSSVLPSGLLTAAKAEGFVVGAQARGFVFNADLVDLIRFLDIGTRASTLR
jgi:hypothetical protein